MSTTFATVTPNTFAAPRGVVGRSVPSAEVEAGMFIYWRGMFRLVLEVLAPVYGINGVLPTVTFRVAGTRARYVCPVRYDEGYAPTTQEVATVDMVAAASARI